MKLIKIDVAFLTSKVARRIFSLFIFCTLLPLLMITGISYISVKNQLNEQTKEKINQTCKAKGLEIYQRLLFLETQLKMIASELIREQEASVNLQPLYTNEESDLYFNGLIMMQGHHKLVIQKDIANPPFFSKPARKHIESKRTLISIQKHTDTSANIYFSQLLNQKHAEKGILIAEINNSYLWGLEKAGELSTEMEIFIINQKKTLLFSSLNDSVLNKIYYDAFESSVSIGNFEIEHGNKAYFAGYWSLFLKHRFFTPSWVIIVSAPKVKVMEPVSEYKKIFILLLLLTFWIVAYLSVSLIRKSLIPIETLREGTQRIADGEFGYTLEIDSNDEFETLGHSFNEMSLKLKKSQEMLVQSAKMGTFGQMAAGIVHEIGQPLSAIMGFADILLMSKPSAKQQKYLEIVRRELNRLAAVIARFRSYSQASSEKMQPLSINRIIDDAYTLLEHQVCNKGIEFNVDKAPDLPDVAGDEDSLKQVLINLVINARDALEERPDHRQFINIKTGLDETNVYVEIEDNGSGMSPEIQKQIFDPFFTTKSKDKGTGLGLAIIESILHKHQAHIRLESEEGVGTRFKISFPAIKDAYKRG